MFKREHYLPDVPIFGFIGGIPDSFGGRTSVCLERANAFAELDRRYIDVLTLSPAHGVSPESVTQRLRDEGRIGRRVSIRNIWSDLRRAGNRQLRALAKGSRVIDMSRLAGQIEPNGGLDAFRRSDDGTVLQTDRLRKSGTRVVSIQSDVGSPGQRGETCVTIFDRAGAPIGQWGDQRELYFAWLDWVIAGRRSILINDGPALGSYLYKYQRDHVVFVQTIHSRHNSKPKSTNGTHSKVYLPTLVHMDAFDLVTVLTKSQRDDLRAFHLASDNVVVVPNMVSEAGGMDATSRLSTHGLVLARLSRQKRIDHAVRAVAGVADRGVTVSLDIYGVEDDASEEIRSLIVDSGMGDVVHLRGYDPRAKQKLNEAGFALITSKYEGFSLVIVEAMARGCIPIAYDLDYGPSDIITHGVDGFLVPNGDTNALGEAIRCYLAMSDVEVAHMRDAARRRARAFSPEAITREWGGLLEEALTRKVPLKTSPAEARLRSFETEPAGVRLRIEIAGVPMAEVEWVRLAWVQRKGLGYGRNAGELHRGGDGVLFNVVIPFGQFGRLQAGVLDFYVDVKAGSKAVRRRVKVTSEFGPSNLDGTRFYSTKYGNLSGERLSAI